MCFQPLGYRFVARQFGADSGLRPFDGSIEAGDFGFGGRLFALGGGKGRSCGLEALSQAFQLAPACPGFALRATGRRELGAGPFERRGDGLSREALQIRFGGRDLGLGPHGAFFRLGEHPPGCCCRLFRVLDVFPSRFDARRRRGSGMLGRTADWAGLALGKPARDDCRH